MIPLEPSSPALERSDRWWQIYKPVDGPELHSTTFVTERTINFIEETPGEGSPWLAWASFPDPHHPMTPPGDWWRRHDPADMELPATVDDPLDNAPVDLRHVRNLGADKQRGWVGMFGTDGLKSTRHGTGEDQLFDLAADHDETTELSGSETSMKALAIERLADALIEADDNARGAPAA